MRLPRTVQDLARSLDRAGAGAVAWAGPGGELYYRLEGSPHRELEELAQTAASPAELISSALGWYTARRLQGLGSSLTVVLEDGLDAPTLEVVDSLSRREADVLLVLLDLGRRYIYAGWNPFNRESRGKDNLAPVLERLGVQYLGSTDGRRPERLQKDLEVALERQGTRLLHVLGESKDRPDADTARAERVEQFYLARPPARPAEPEPVQTRRTSLPETLASNVLARLATELSSDERVLVFWSRGEGPGSMIALGDRLVRRSLHGAVGEARGAAHAGLYPVIVLSARSLPAGLGDLMEGIDYATTLIVLEGGLNPHPHPACLRDLSLLRCVPGLVVAAPADEDEAMLLSRAAREWHHPLVLRFTSSPAVGMATAAVPSASMEPGQGRRLRSGKDVSILSVGSTVFPAVLAAEKLRSWGVDAGVYDCRFVSPMDGELLEEAALSGRILAVEEHACQGGLATAVLEGLAQLGLHRVELQGLGLDDRALVEPQATLEHFGLHAEGIACAARDLLGLGKRS
ncbi:MAG: hypothetical protein HY319_18030 [Armatimonadetes bacterium]|nr:hypothetical protein [Armatimonadota bacterium]